MKRSSAYAVILLILVLIIALLGFLILRRQAPENEAPTEPPATAEVQPPRDEDNSTPTPPPSDSPEPTEEPVFETRPPVETEAPEETPEPTETPVPDASGSLSSNTGTGLNIRADWYTLPGGQKLQVDVFCISYSISSAAQWQSVQLSVDGRSYAADSRAVNYDGSDQVASPLASFTVDAPPSGSSITVTWNYRGSYSGQELNEIVASGSIVY